MKLDTQMVMVVERNGLCRARVCSGDDETMWPMVQLLECTYVTRFAAKEGQLEWLFSHNRDLRYLLLDADPEQYADPDSLRLWPQQGLNQFDHVVLDEGLRFPTPEPWDTLAPKLPSECNVCLHKNGQWYVVLGEQDVFVPFEPAVLMLYLAHQFKSYRHTYSTWDDVVHAWGSDMLMEWLIATESTEKTAACVWYSQQPALVQQLLASHPSDAENLCEFLSLCPQVVAQRIAAALESPALCVRRKM